MSLQAIDDNSGLLERVRAVDGNLRIANLVWDTTTLSWVKQTQSVSGGAASDVNVLNSSLPVTGTFWQATQPVSGPVTDAQLRAAPVPTIGVDKASRVEDLGSTIYIAKAALGTADAYSAWQIKRITFSGALTNTHWANGNSNYTNTWDARASYTYS